MLGQAMDVGHAWMIFLAITGNFDNPGGQAIPDTTPVANIEPMPEEADLHKFGWHRTGPDKEKFKDYSFIMEPTWYQAQAIRNGDLKVLIVSEANPAKVSMGEREWQKAVTEKDGKGNYKLDMLVVHEIFMSETAKYADLVLPEKSYFERLEMFYMPWMYHYGHDIMIREPIVEPLGECRHTNEIYIDLGKRLVPEYFRVKDIKDYYNKQLSSLGLSINKLHEMGNAWSPGTMGFKKYEDRGFGTPSKKVEIYWDELEDIDRALPSPDLAAEYGINVEKYPYILVSYRTIFHQGTGMWSHNNPQLRDSASGISFNPALVNPAVAEKLGIQDGDIVTIKSNWGEVSIPACVTERIKPDCIGLMHGFGGGKQGRVSSQGCGVSDNILIPDAGSNLEYQDLVGGESHVSCRVNIIKEGN
ncbi:MAG TPA: molybdopterin dinucleotide binding domain-containing protein [Victivallales bacterium]|nr:molybdopterin dinucleotide binding domain-containing protein [Victivallales bacterium]